PHSKWVAREIELFDEMGRGDRVLALLVDGEPEQAFPLVLRERRESVTGPDGAAHETVEAVEPLAADVRPRHEAKIAKPKHFARLRLLACLLGCKFDDLRQRDRDRQRRRRLAWGSLAAAVVLLTAGAATTYWHMMQPITGHYRDLVWRWGVPEGLAPIDEETR